MTNIPNLVNRINEAGGKRQYEWVAGRGGIEAILLPDDPDFDNPLKIYFGPDEYSPGIVRRGDADLSSRTYRNDQVRTLEAYLSDKVNYRNFWQIQYFPTSVSYKEKKVTQEDFSQLPRNIRKRLAITFRAMLKDFLKNKAKKDTILSWNKDSAKKDDWFFKNVLVQMSGYERGDSSGYRFLIPKSLVSKNPRVK